MVYYHYTAIPTEENSYGTGITPKRSIYTRNPNSVPRSTNDGLNLRIRQASRTKLPNGSEMVSAGFIRKNPTKLSQFCEQNTFINGLKEDFIRTTC